MIADGLLAAMMRRRRVLVAAGLVALNAAPIVVAVGVIFGPETTAVQTGEFARPFASNSLVSTSIPYVELENLASGKALDPTGVSSWEKRFIAPQTLTESGDFLLISRDNPKLCLDLKDQPTIDGTKLIMRPCDGTPSQQWFQKKANQVVLGGRGIFYQIYNRLAQQLGGAGVIAVQNDSTGDIARASLSRALPLGDAENQLFRTLAVAERRSQ